MIDDFDIFKLIDEFGISEKPAKLLLRAINEIMTHELTAEGFIHVKDRTFVRPIENKFFHIIHFYPVRHEGRILSWGLGLPFMPEVKDEKVKWLLKPETTKITMALSGKIPSQDMIFFGDPVIKVSLLAGGDSIRLQLESQWKNNKKIILDSLSQFYSFQALIHHIQDCYLKSILISRAYLDEAIAYACLLASMGKLEEAELVIEEWSKENKKSAGRKEIIRNILKLVFEKLGVSTLKVKDSALAGWTPPIKRARDFVPESVETQIKTKDLSAVKRFLKDEAHLGLIDRDGKSLLSIACEAGFSELAKFLIKKGLSVHHQDDLGRTPLHFAFLSDNLDIASMLLKNSADPAVKDKEGISCIACSLRQKDGSGLILLLKFGYPPSEDHFKMDAGGNTALHRLSEKGSEFLIIGLVSTGHDINKKNIMGRTPLHLAILSENFSNAKLLVRLGANPILEDHYRSTSLDLLFHLQCKQEKQLLEMIDLLMGFGVPIVHPYQKVNPLCWPAEFGFYHVVKKILDLGVSPNYVPSGNIQDPAVANAVLNGHFDIVKMLVYGGADLTFKKRNGEPLVNQALSHPEILAFLIQKGAPVDQLNSRGETSLDVAIARQCREAIHLLQSVGVNETEHETRLTDFPPFAKAVSLFLGRQAKKDTAGSKTRFVLKFRKKPPVKDLTDLEKSLSAVRDRDLWFAVPGNMMETLRTNVLFSECAPSKLGEGLQKVRNGKGLLAFYSNTTDWTCLFAPCLFERPDVAASILMDLSVSAEEALMFGALNKANWRFWFRVRHQEIKRMFEYHGESGLIRFLGPHTSAEEKILPYYYDQTEEEWRPSLEDVVQIASAWSFNPAWLAFLEKDWAKGQGYLMAVHTEKSIRGKNQNPEPQK